MLKATQEKQRNKGGRGLVGCSEFLEIGRNDIHVISFI